MSDPSSRVAVLVISGPVGVGKTTCGSALSEQLEARGVAHTLVDLDALRQTFPRPADDRFGTQLGLQNLRGVWTNAAAAGARNLILSDVVETDGYRAALRAAIPNADLTVVQLEAPTTTIAARVRQRELGSGLTWHLNRAVELGEILKHAPADVRLPAIDSPSQIAQALCRTMTWVEAAAI